VREGKKDGENVGCEGSNADICDAVESMPDANCKADSSVFNVGSSQLNTFDGVVRKVSKKWW